MRRDQETLRRDTCAVAEISGPFAAVQQAGNSRPGTQPSFGSGADSAALATRFQRRDLIRAALFL
jgi:hypothetical protein